MSKVARPLHFFSYATTVGIHSSLLLFTALFLPRTSLVVFNGTSNFPFRQPASSLDRPQPEFLEALTTSPPLTLAWLCAGVFLLSFSWGGRIRRQAYEQPINKTDFEAKKEEMEWQKQSAVVRLHYSRSFSSPSNSAEPAKIAHLNSPGCCLLPHAHCGLRGPDREVRRALPSTCQDHSLKLVATTSKPFSLHSFYPFLHTFQPPTFLGRLPLQC